MDKSFSNFQKSPLKLYIQDIFRANRSHENKYIYEIFGMSFKNIMIHGVITCVYNKTGATTNLELSDPTGTVQVYYDSTKHNLNVPNDKLKFLHRDFATQYRFGDDNMDIKLKMLDAISSTKQNVLNFEEGNYASIIGDIFIDDIRNIRMVSAYQCEVTTIERDIVWLEELRYLYEKFYLWYKVE
ncbi:uncharacterized protein LOC126378198 [Pectinophora gossypiella]|uniref:uncharacterized protein LOC126378198 n=1 Tax=Pectinophora gossypiella TaxID=13191 RepID=UPI00214E18E4|nr:uncharacterized protein LOC126378198 [Pectinophora gossypiella]